VSYRTTLVICATPQSTYDAVTDPRSWWGERVEGESSAVGDEFTFEVVGVHWSRLRVVESSPERIEWEVLDARIEYVAEQDEWTGTRIVFELEPVPDGTRLTFVHDGLLPELECYDSCSQAWAALVHGSLRALITEGVGAPYAASPVAG
jgi:Activator of Hsp90 ATPase homolog 1-like protein